MFITTHAWLYIYICAQHVYVNCYLRIEDLMDYGGYAFVSLVKSMLPGI